MEQALVVSNVVLWIVVLVLVAVVFALARQIGVLHERIAPMGALVMDHGPAVGDLAPVVAARALDGRALQVGAPDARQTLLFFLSPSCPVCKKLLPAIESLARTEAARLQVVLASDGDDADTHRRFVERHALQAFPYLLSQPLGMAWRVGKLPHAVLIGADGRVAAKGLVNSREQLESLLLADDLGVASVQEYVARRGAAPAAGEVRA
jgi:methylamine dehydrogenase accessory protein MauD